MIRESEFTFYTRASIHFVSHHSSQCSAHFSRARSTKAKNFSRRSVKNSFLFFFLFYFRSFLLCSRIQYKTKNKRIFYCQKVERCRINFSFCWWRDRCVEYSFIRNKQKSDFRFFFFVANCENRKVEISAWHFISQAAHTQANVERPNVIENVDIVDSTSERQPTTINNSNRASVSKRATEREASIRNAGTKFNILIRKCFAIKKNSSREHMLTDNVCSYFCFAVALGWFIRWSAYTKTLSTFNSCGFPVNQKWIRSIGCCFFMFGKRRE